MTTPTPTPHVHIDPRFGFSLFTPTDNPERDEFARLAAAGRHDEVRAILNQAVRACRAHIDNREVAVLLRMGQSIKRQAV